ncbi:MAG TPA: signal peptidase I [Candidatus Acidoferrales bacterium]
MTEEKDKKTEEQKEEKLPLKTRAAREAMSWFWVILAFLFIHGTIVQARVIPSESMVETLLVGDHLLVNRLGYDAEIPLTGKHWPLWRTPQRQQVVVFRSVQPNNADLVKRLIGMPGDTLEVREGAVWINGRPLVEPYLYRPHSPGERFGPVVVPENHYFMMGDNRGNSLDSRYWGFVPRDHIIGTPLIIYMSLDADPRAWEPGQLGARVSAYLGAIFKPSRIRWSRLFVTF